MSPELSLSLIVAFTAVSAITSLCSLAVACFVVGRSGK